MLHTAQLISLATSLFLSGINFGAFHLTVPILHGLDVQTPATFASLYHRGARLTAPLAVLSTLTSALVAVQSTGHERAKWIVAAVATFASLPFTRVVVTETSRTLLKFAGEDATLEERHSLKGDQERQQDKEEVVGLLRRWKKMNLLRSAFSLVGGLAAVVAVVFRT
ncbi:hypothetical protein BKA67DRAFT_531857 [Truncatella angustata]|uniref:DUF1772-domain-containing protein n=1 Tax=Truncatella angustata TaxID=152316 RepID=A0A9P8UQZ5_9PEZI|nr:uncharacterized protein BKA67DRAFT_531857 [Truncatella angustata]KAH6656596.1 hypothetical protein BKA67DRAFT_531857 [Truncatella angustata]